MQRKCKQTETLLTPHYRAASAFSFCANHVATMALINSTVISVPLSTSLPSGQAGTCKNNTGLSTPPSSSFSLSLSQNHAKLL